MKKQLTLDFEEPLIERIAMRFSEQRIYKMLHKGWIPEVVADNAIRKRTRMGHRSSDKESQFFYEVGKRLKTARIEAGLTQDNMADKVWVSFQQVQKYEDGINRISLFKLVTWAELTGKPLSYFYVEGESDE